MFKSQPGNEILTSDQEYTHIPCAMYRPCSNEVDVWAMDGHETKHSKRKDKIEDKDEECTLARRPVELGGDYGTSEYTKGSHAG